MALGLLAVIPARGGSKRLPHKNVQELRGRPLIAYTIDAALECGLFDSVVVSTDSEEIAHIAAQCGASVPFMRDSSLADDHTPVSAATLDALCRLDPHGTKYTAVAQLMANCPLRTADDIAMSYQEFTASESPAQISVCPYGWLNPWWAMTRDGRGQVTPVFEEMLRQRSQDLPGIYCPSGAIWWAKVDVLRANGTFHVPGRTGFVMSPTHALDIDDENDWRMAEVLSAMELAR